LDGERNVLFLNAVTCYVVQRRLWLNKIRAWNIWSIAVYGADIWTLRKVEQKYLESFEMWYWRRVEMRID